MSYAWQPASSVFSKKGDFRYQGPKYKVVEPVCVAVLIVASSWRPRRTAAPGGILDFERPFSQAPAWPGSAVCETVEAAGGEHGDGDHPLPFRSDVSVGMAGRQVDPAGARG